MEKYEINISQQPVTRRELLDKYGIVCVGMSSECWSKDITFVAQDGKPYKCVLYWDMIDGYEIVWEGVPPKDLMDLADRPEFEYMVDSIATKYPDDVDIAQDIATILHVYKEDMFNDNCDMDTEYEVIQNIISLLERNGYVI
jgi:hypothetical protein